MFHLLFLFPTVAIAEVQEVAAGPELNLIDMQKAYLSPCLIRKQNQVNFLFRAEFIVAHHRSLTMMYPDIEMKILLPGKGNLF